MAKDLLRAWSSRDAARMDAELRRTLSVSVEVDDLGEEERRNVLHAVATRMATRTQEDPIVDTCVKLLEHLVNPA
jgi:hypothetical protein